MWMVRSGGGGYLYDEFKSKNIVAIGWNDVGNLTKLKDSENIRTAVAKAYAYSGGKLINTASQLLRFLTEIKNGDKVITYNSSTRMYSIGKIISDYLYDPTLTEYAHIRKVEWLGELSRDLVVNTRNTLGSTLTLFKISNEAENELLQILKIGSVAKPQNSAPDIQVDDKRSESLEILKDELVERAHEFIKDKVLLLDWEEMQELVAGLLRAMGYKTQVSAKGPDRGRDIIASPDGLGLEEPRIVVEVKHRTGQMGADKIRGFIGGLRDKDKGLYVSTGGFAKEAKYEAERANVPINLVDLDLLVNLITQYYDSFDTDAKSLISLRKIYWPL